MYLSRVAKSRSVFQSVGLDPIALIEVEAQMTSTHVESRYLRRSWHIPECSVVVEACQCVQATRKWINHNSLLLYSSTAPSLIVLDYPSTVVVTSYLLTGNLLPVPLTLFPSQMTSCDSRVHDALPTHLCCRMTESVCAIDLHRKISLRDTYFVCDDELDRSFEVHCDEVSRVLAGAAGTCCFM
jgi:hypothetical protein